MTFKTLPADQLPRSEAVGRAVSNVEVGAGKEFIRSVVERWRGAALGYKARQDETPIEQEAAGFKEPGSAGDRLDRLRAQILKR